MSIKRCPNCSTGKLSVTDSRPDREANNCYRRYKCECGHRFSTLETVLPEMKKIEALSGHAVARIIDRVMDV